MRKVNFTRSGFSLVETLVVISIISVVSGIMVPVLVNSKKSAVKTDDLSKMRQLGQAAAMYESQYGEFPLRTTQLVDAGMVPVQLCTSTLDSSATGLGNELVDFTNKKLPLLGKIPDAGYKNSFIGLGDFGMNTKVVDDYVATGPAAGWLIDATDSKKTEWPTPTQWKGTYRRLTMDGAVVVRKYEDYQCYNDGKRMPCRMSVLLFVDPNPYFAELQKSDDQQSSHSQD